MELKLDIIKSTESQKIKLQAQYENKLGELEIRDPKLIAKSKWIDDLTKWPNITLGNIFCAQKSQDKTRGHLCNKQRRNTNETPS